MPNPYEQGPLTEDEFNFIAQGEKEEAAAENRKVKIERVTVGGKLFIKVSYPS